MVAYNGPINRAFLVTIKARGPTVDARGPAVEAGGPTVQDRGRTVDARGPAVHLCKSNQGHMALHLPLGP